MKMLVNLMILAILTILTTPQSFAQTGATGGGGAVVKDNEVKLADYFYHEVWQKAEYTKMQIPADVRAEIEDLKNLASYLEISFGNSFWDCDILNKCANTLTEYRIVKKLPIEVIMQIKQMRGLTAYQPFAYTPGNIEELNISPTYIDESVYNKLDLTDKAIALVHERIWAHFGLDRSYDDITSYTTTLRMLRDVEAGRRQYDEPAHHLFVQGYLASKALQEHVGGFPNKYDSYMLTNGGKCVLFAHNILNPSDIAVTINDGSSAKCTGFYKMVNNWTWDMEKHDANPDWSNSVPLDLSGVDPKNLLEIDLKDHILIPFISISVKGSGNLVSIDATMPKSNCRGPNTTFPIFIEGDQNTVANVKTSTIKIIGSKNILQNANLLQSHVVAGVSIQGSQNFIEDINTRQLSGELGNYTYSCESISNLPLVKVSGDSNYIDHTTLTGINGNNNRIINKSVKTLNANNKTKVGRK